MEIVTQTTDEIIFKYCNWRIPLGIGFILVGLAVTSSATLSFVEGSSSYLSLNIMRFFFLLLALFMLLSAHWTTVNINKVQGKISLRQRRLWDVKNRVFNISDAARVEMRKAEGDVITRTLTQQPFLVFKDATVIPLGRTSKAGIANKETSDSIHIAHQIAELLNVPLQEINTSLLKIG